MSVEADKNTANRHAPDLPAGGLRRLSQRYADGALSESGYRDARRSYIERVIAGEKEACESAALEGSAEAFEATQPLPVTPRPLRTQGRPWRTLMALALVVVLGGAIVYLAAGA